MNNYLRLKHKKGKTQKNNENHKKQINSQREANKKNKNQ